MADIDTLNKKIIFSDKPDTPDCLHIVVPELNPASTLPRDQFRLETYIRLKSLPSDMVHMVGCLLEAKALCNKIENTIPALPRAKPRHHPNGVVELQWKMDDGSIFGVILHNFIINLTEDGNEFILERKGKISWRYHGPKIRPQQGEFKSSAELLEFMTQSIR